MGHFHECACKDAIETPNSKNKRNNVSILISGERNQEEFNVLIDCGKTFRQAYFETLVKRGLRKVDALLITHDHADAVQGLDDLRDLQKFAEHGQHWVCEHFVPTFMTNTTLEVLEKQVGYIIRNSRVMGTAGETSEAYRAGIAAFEQRSDSNDTRVIPRRSTALDVWLVSDLEPQKIFVPGLECPVYTFPVDHGKDYVSLGFVFGSGVAFSNGDDDVDGGCGDCIVYLSDVSWISEATMDFLKRLKKIDVLVVDMLLGKGTKHFSHYCWDDAWELTRILQPRRVYGTGMYCVLEHHQTTSELGAQLLVEKAEGRCLQVDSFELAYDGMILPFS